ncbi:MAG: ABC transporter ATP-binding protein [Sporichthyaceae bacterium]
MSAALACENLTIGHHRQALVRSIDLSVEPGQIVTLLGANGSGKSTLLQTVVGTVPAVGGRLRIGTEYATAWPVRRRVAAGLGFSPEGRRIFASMNVEANLLVGTAALHRRLQRRGFDTALNLFPELAERLRQPAGSLSGGEQQMLAIGRALMGEPRVLLVEEPSQGLAPTIVDRLYRAFRELADGGTALLVAEQFQQLRPGVSDVVVAIRGDSIAPADEQTAAGNRRAWS